VFALSSLAGCGQQCDADGLSAAADAMGDRSMEGRRVAFTKLGEACPGLPSMLGHSLMASYGGQPPDLAAQVYAARNDDRGFVRARSSACRASKEAWNEAAQQSDRSAAVFAACDFQRFDLLEDGEVFDFEDMDAYILHDWLLEHRADRAVARRLVRGLLVATGVPHAVMTACVHDDRGCENAFAAYSMHAAQVSSRRPSFPPDTIVVLGPHELFVDGEGVATLDGGHFASDVVHEHEIAPLLAVLKGEKAKGEAKAEKNGEVWEGRLVVAAGEGAPFESVLEVLYTATQAGYHNHHLLASHRGSGALVPVYPASSWAPGMGPDRVARGGAKQLEVTVSSRQIQVRRRDTETTVFDIGDCDDALCFDVKAVQEELERRHGEFEGEEPERSWVVRVSEGVTLGTLVALVDAGLGEDCKIIGYDTEVANDCHYLFPIIDSTKGMSWRKKYRDSLALEEGKTRRAAADRRKGPPLKKIESIYESSKADIRKCLLEDEEFMSNVYDGGTVVVLFGADEGPDTEVSLLNRAMTGRDSSIASYELAQCVGRIYDMAPADLSDTEKLLQRYQSDLEFRVRFGPNAD